MANRHTAKSSISKQPITPKQIDTGQRLEYSIQQHIQHYGKVSDRTKLENMVKLVKNPDGTSLASSELKKYKSDLKQAISDYKISGTNEPEFKRKLLKIDGLINDFKNKYNNYIVEPTTPTQENNPKTPAKQITYEILRQKADELKEGKSKTDLLNYLVSIKEDTKNISKSPASKFGSARGGGKWKRIGNNANNYHYLNVAATTPQASNLNIREADDQAKVKQYLGMCTDLQFLYALKHKEVIEGHRLNHDICFKFNEVNKYLHDIVNNLKEKKDTVQLLKILTSIPGLDKLMEAQKTMSETINESTSKVNGTATATGILSGVVGGGSGVIRGGDLDTIPKQEYETYHKIKNTILNPTFINTFQASLVLYNICILSAEDNMNDSTIIDIGSLNNSNKFIQPGLNTSKWTSMNINTTTTTEDEAKFYFKIDKNKGSKVTDRTKLQQIIYQCADLEILYVNKHLELLKLVETILYSMNYYDTVLGWLIQLLELFETYVGISDAGIKIFEIIKNAQQMILDQQKIKKQVDVISKEITTSMTGKLPIPHTIIIPGTTNPNDAKTFQTKLQQNSKFPNITVTRKNKTETGVKELWNYAWPGVEVPEYVFLIENPMAGGSIIQIQKGGVRENTLNILSIAHSFLKDKNVKMEHTLEPLLREFKMSDVASKSMEEDKILEAELKNARDKLQYINRISGINEGIKTTHDTYTKAKNFIDACSNVQELIKGMDDVISSFPKKLTEAEQSNKNTIEEEKTQFINSIKEMKLQSLLTFKINILNKYKELILPIHDTENLENTILHLEQKIKETKDTLKDIAQSTNKSGGSKIVQSGGNNVNTVSLKVIQNDGDYNIYVAKLNNPIDSKSITNGQFIGLSKSSNVGKVDINMNKFPENEQKIKELITDIWNNIELTDIKFVKTVTKSDFDAKSSGSSSSPQVIINKELQEKINKEKNKLKDLDKQIGTLLDEYEKLIEEFKAILPKVSESLEAGKTDLDANILMEIQTKITEKNETVLGSARVIIKYRDDNDSVKEQANKMLYKIGKSCVAIPYCAEICNPVSTEGGTTHTEQPTVYGPFKQVFTEGNDTTNIFNTSFVKDGLIKFLKEGNSLVVFGFGFSGSGKTYQLTASGNQENLLKQTIKALLSGDKPVGTITLKVQELYPYADRSDPGYSNGNTIQLLKSNASNEKDKIKAIGEPLVIKNLEDLTKIYKLFEKIERERINHMRIAPTPNNPVSSRSHIFYELEFTVESKTGRLVIVDMAGAENTIEIRKQFLLYPGFQKEFNSLTAKEYTYSLMKHNIADEKVILQGGTLDPLNNFITSTNLLNLLKLFTDVKNEKSLTSKKPPIKTIPLILKYVLNVNYTKILALANKKSLRIVMDEENKPKDDGMIPKSIKLKNITPIMMVKIYNNFIDKISTSYDNKPDKDEKGEWKGIPVDNGITYHFKDPESKQGELSSSQEELISNIIEKYFHPFDLLFLSKDFDIIGTINDVILKKGYTPVKIKEDLISSVATGIYKKNDNTTVLQENNDIDYKNPFILILTAYIYLLYTKIFTENDSNDIKKANSKIYVMFVLTVIVKYIDIIVNQGQGIITTLEHLKYFFLYNSAQHMQLLRYNHHKTNKEEKLEGNLTDSKIFTKNDPRVGMSEDVEVGMIDKYKMLDILVDLATKQTVNYDSLESVTRTIDIYTKGNPKPTPTTITTKLIQLPIATGIAKFLMLAAIRRGKAGTSGLDPNENSKYCASARDTLEFAHSITSVPPPCNPASIGNCELPKESSSGEKQSSFNGGYRKKSLKRRVKRSLKGYRKRYNTKKVNKRSKKLLKKKKKISKHLVKF